MQHPHPRPSDPANAWVVWNGAHGIVATAAMGRIEEGPTGRTGWLERPFDMVGPFDLDELLAQGQIAFAACIVMSRLKWQAEQVRLRQESHARRRAAQERFNEQQARFHHGHSRHRHAGHARAQVDENQLRRTLNLPTDGRLEPAQIKTAFRRLAQKLHPDMGGTQEQFVRITEARNALLERVARP